MSVPESSGAMAGGEMRPAGVGELLSRIWMLLRGNVWLYVKLAVLPVGVLAVSEGLLFWKLHSLGLFPPHPGPPNPQLAWVELVGMFAIIPPLMVAYVLFEGATCVSALAGMRSTRLSFREAYGMAGRRAGRLIWLLVLRTLAAVLPWIVVVAVVTGAIAAMAMQGAPHPGLYFVLWPLVVVLFLGGLAWVIWISLHLCLGVPACMAEDVSAWTACKRSGRLSHGGKGRIFVVIFLVYLIGMAAIIVFEMVVFALTGVGALAGMLLHVHLALPHTMIWIVPLAILLIAWFYLVIALQWAGFSITMTVLYDDQRFRSEGIAPMPLTGEPT